ncbi:hypothetical protein DFH29DRAFT_1004402 [Suillus ampliporus]|nr:hypothetical protein DFH29DRAFT_1004402 [Suillus ampliporus]
MNTNTNNSSEAPKVYIYNEIQSQRRDDAFRAMAVPSQHLKAQRKAARIQCSQCQTILEKPSTCKKCKSVWYCSKEVGFATVKKVKSEGLTSRVLIVVPKEALVSQRYLRLTQIETSLNHDRPAHKPNCHEVERSSGVLKFVQMFQANQLLMAYLEICIGYECGLFDNPRIGLDVPFMARVYIATEPSNFPDFVGLYLNDKAVGEKLQGMVQVNAIMPSLTPMPPSKWDQARARHTADGFAKDLVGLVEFIGCSEGSGNSIISELYIPTMVLDMARKHKPFVTVNSFTGAQLKTPVNTASCLQFINMHIREDKKNQLSLRAEMTQQDKEVIRAAGRNEDALPARLLKEKMQRERLYKMLI